MEGQSKEKMDLLMAFLASVVFITAPLLILFINNLYINTWNKNKEISEVKTDHQQL